jgi:hypothetical protein
VSKGERLKIAKRTRRGRRQKAKQGLLVAPSVVAYGFLPNPERNGYLVDEITIPVVRRAFQMIADGAGISGVKGTFEREGVPTPTGGRLWSRSTLRDFVTKDVYFPHTYEEIAALVSPQVVARLDKEKSYGVWWASRHDWKVVERVKRPDGQYRDRRRRTEKPREEWIAVPVPDAGIPREVAERARRNVQRNFAPPKRQSGLGGRRGRSRAWELAGGLAVCGAGGCGRRMIGHTVAPAKRKKTYHYYLCPKKSEVDWKNACSNRNHRAADLEA